MPSSQSLPEGRLAFDDFCVVGVATQSIPQSHSPVEPSKAPAVVVPVTPFPRAVTQEELQEIIFLRRNVETPKGLEADLKQRLEAGATVEDGIHIARFLEVR